MTIERTTKSVEQTIQLGMHIGSHLRGGEVFELMSDLGGGKTTFMRGVAKGFGSYDPVSSPSFTICYVYSRPDKKQLHHFDFYRLHDAGIVGSELADALNDDMNVIAIEWGEIVHDILPVERIKITIKNSTEDERLFHIEYPKIRDYLFENI